MPSHLGFLVQIIGLFSTVVRTNAFMTPDRSNRLECLYCDRVNKWEDCLGVAACLSDVEACYMETEMTEFGEIVFNAGCRSRKTCEVIGCFDDVSQHTNKTIYFNGRALQCHHCCHGDFCNLYGCTPHDAFHTEVRCMYCPSVEHPQQCTTLQYCSSQEQCILNPVYHAGGLRFELGCESKQICDLVKANKKKRLDHFNGEIGLGHVSCCEGHICNRDYPTREGFTSVSPYLNPEYTCTERTEFLSNGLYNDTLLVNITYTASMNRSILTTKAISSPNTTVPFHLTSTSGKATSTQVTTIAPSLTTTSKLNYSTNKSPVSISSSTVKTYPPMTKTSLPVSTTNPTITTRFAMTTGNSPTKTTKSPASKVTTTLFTTTTKSQAPTTTFSNVTTKIPTSAASLPVTKTNLPVTTTSSPITTTNLPVATTNLPVATTIGSQESTTMHNNASRSMDSTTTTVLSSVTSPNNPIVTGCPPFPIYCPANCMKIDINQCPTCDYANCGNNLHQDTTTPTTLTDTLPTEALTSTTITNSLMSETTTAQGHPNTDPVTLTPYTPNTLFSTQHTSVKSNSSNVTLVYTTSVASTSSKDLQSSIPTSSPITTNTFPSTVQSTNTPRTTPKLCEDASSECDYLNKTIAICMSHTNATNFICRAFCGICDNTSAPPSSNQSNCLDLSPDCKHLDDREQICSPVTNATVLMCSKYCGLCGGDPSS